MAKRIVGGMVGVPNPQSDWNQTDPKKADYIKNKPNFNEYVDSKLENLREQISDKAGVDYVNESVSLAYLDLDSKKADEVGVANMFANISAQIKQKVDKVDGKGLSTNDFTNEEKETLKHINYCNISEDWSYITENAILEILQNENYKEGINIVRATFEYGFLLVSFSDYFQAFFISTEGRIYFFQDESVGNGEWQLMGEVYASTKYVDDAIGDVETALENIIAKYGLGGDDV